MNQKDEVFLIDSNSLISPYQLYYPFDFASRFWDQLKEKIEDGNVIILDVIKDELMKGNDELSKWINQFDHNLILDRRTSEILENYGKVRRPRPSSPLSSTAIRSARASGATSSPR